MKKVPQNEQPFTGRADSAEERQVIATVSQGLPGELRILLTLAATNCWTIVMILSEKYGEL